AVACGRRALRLVVLAEHALLLGAGLAAGTVAALVAIAPAALARGAAAPLVPIAALAAPVAAGGVGGWRVARGRGASRSPRWRRRWRRPASWPRCWRAPCCSASPCCRRCGPSSAPAERRPHTLDTRAPRAIASVHHFRLISLRPAARSVRAAVAPYPPEEN